MKKNWIMWVLGFGALYLVTRKSSTTTTTTTEETGTPDLGNGSTPTPNATPQASTPPIELEQAQSSPTVNSSSTDVFYASTSPSMGEPKNVYSI